MSFHIRVRASALIIRDEAILLIEFQGQQGLHYNLPAGGVELGETTTEAVLREAKEEAAVAVEVGPLVFVNEHAPHLKSFADGSLHSLDFIFACQLKPGSKPMMPPKPDPNQTDVKWMSLSQLHTVALYPCISEQIIQYAQDPVQHQTRLLQI